MSKEIYLWGLSWAGVRQVDSHIYMQNLKRLIGALTKFSQVYHPDGLKTIFLSQNCILRATYGSGEGKWNSHSEDRGGEEERRSLPLPGPSIMSSWWRPVFHSSLPQRTLNGQQGTPLAGRWLIRWLSDYIGGKCHNNNTGICKRKHKLRQSFPNISDKFLNREPHDLNRW